jgi:4-hydroxybenzoate polyprenyltransferase
MDGRRNDGALMFDPAVLLLSLVTGGVGFVLLVYGKKQGRWPQLVAGLAYMIYPYFVDTALTMIIVGVVLGAGLWLAIREGW